MAEPSGTKLNHASHIQMVTPHQNQTLKLTRQDQPLLRLPYELHRNNFKTAQRNIEQSQTKVEELIRAALRSVAANPRDAEASIDAATARLKTLRAKLQSLDKTQRTLVGQSDARLAHAEDLYAVQSLADAGYEKWSRTRLDRLLVDYMARSGFMRSAKQLVEDKGLEALVDVDEFEAVGRIVHSLRVDHRIDPAMAWCGENKQNLRKLQVGKTAGRWTGLIRAGKLVRVRAAPAAVHRNGALRRAGKDLRGDAAREQASHGRRPDGHVHSIGGPAGVRRRHRRGALFGIFPRLFS
jgi:hypothetical protein